MSDLTKSSMTSREAIEKLNILLACTDDEWKIIDEQLPSVLIKKLLLKTMEDVFEVLHVPPSPLVMTGILLSLLKNLVSTGNEYFSKNA